MKKQKNYSLEFKSGVALQAVREDGTRAIPEICEGLGGIQPSIPYHYVHVNGSLTSAGRDLLEKDCRNDVVFDSLAGVIGNRTGGKFRCVHLGAGNG